MAWQSGWPGGDSPWASSSWGPPKWPFDSSVSPPLPSSKSSSVVAQTPSRAPSPTSSSTPQSTPELLFHSISSLTACNYALIGWNYTGPASNTMSLSVYGDPGVAAASSSQPSLNRSLASNLNPTSLSWEWNVSIRAGSYRLQARIDAFSVSSDPFNVTNGTDTSCLGASVSSSSAATSISSLLPSSNLPSSSSNNQANTGHAHVHAGVIVGSTVGAVVLLIAICGTFLYFRRHRQFRDRGIEANSSLSNATSSERGLFILFVTCMTAHHNSRIQYTI